MLQARDESTRYGLVMYVGAYLTACMDRQKGRVIATFISEFEDVSKACEYHFRSASSHARLERLQ